MLAMNLAGSIIVVTGGGGGIGAALVAAFVAEGAGAVIVSDRDVVAAERVAACHAQSACMVIAHPADMSSTSDIDALVAAVEGRFGRIDLFCSNAALMTDGGVDVSDDAWDMTWHVNVMAHVRAARAALPGMIARGQGYFVNIASAAGMLTAPGAAPYTTTKHAAVGFAEWLAISHGDQGIGVTLVCPGAVQTNMLATSLAVGNEGVRRVAATSAVIGPEVVAEATIEGVKAGRFLVTPHADTLINTQRKWGDVDRWIRGMRSFLRVAA